MPQFLRSLLQAEAEANGLPADGIHVAEDYFVADGAEDAHIRWEGGPARTPHLPARHTQFQIKTGAITPAKAARDVVTKGGQVKEMVRSALESGGHYMLLCTTSLTGQKAQAIANSIRESIVNAGLSVLPDQIHVQDGDQLAAWTNTYPAIVTRLKERTRPNSAGPFRSWVQWADRSEHTLSPLVDDERLPRLRARLVGELGQPGAVVRVLGAAGVGKSRLVLESLDSNDARGLPMWECVLYADQSEVEETAICGVVRTLSETGARAIVVVDDCPPDTHQRLSGMVTAPRSRLSLVTVDNDEARSASAHDSSTVHVGLAPLVVTEAIIDRELPSLPSEDRRRLLLFSRGFPTIAVRVADAWASKRPMPYSTDRYFVDAFVTGRSDPEPELAVRAAMLIAAFGTVRHTVDRSQVDDLARWGRGITPADIHAALGRLVERGVVQRRGGLVVLQPRPVAMQLTERQWREWAPAQWIALLTGDVNPQLKSNAARQLAWMNDTEVAQDVANTILGPNGPLDGLASLSEPAHARVLLHLAAIDTQLAADCIRRALDDVSDLRSVRGELRRDLVEALEMIAFPADTFDDAASLLLRLAVGETEGSISNNATGQLAALFPILEGATSADGASRIAFLRDAAKTNDPLQRAVVVNALLEGAKTMFFSRMVGAETHGSRPALEPWRPDNGEDAASYVTSCVELLAQQATTGGEPGLAAKARLGNLLRSLVGFGLIEVVEGAVRQARDATGGWPEATESLGHYIQFDTTDATPDIADRVKALVELLQPRTLPERIHDLVSKMPWDYPNGEDLDYDEQRRRQLDAVHGVAQDALRQSSLLAEQLPQLCHGSQRWAAAFGEFLGTRIDSPEVWLDRIATATSQTPSEARNFDLLSGFLKGLYERDSDAVATFKRHVADSADLAPALPAIAAQLGLVDTDIHLAIDALSRRVLPPWSLRYWSMGDALATLPVSSVALLFDELRAHGLEGLVVEVELMGMLAHGARERLEDLKPQIIELAKSIAHSDLQRQGAMVDHHAQDIFKWLLAKGRHDEDARALALTLSHGLAADDAPSNTVNLLSPLLPTLFSEFPEIAWPLISQQMVKRTGSAWHLRHEVRGDSISHRDDFQPPILSLPPDALFAWCGAYPEDAPRCAAGLLPVLGSDNGDANESSLHPLFRRLLDEFGDQEDVLEAASANLHSFGWVGSLTTYFERYVGPIATLHDHSIPRVARWAKRMGRHLQREIEQEQARDDEYKARFEV